MASHPTGVGTWARAVARMRELHHTVLFMGLVSLSVLVLTMTPQLLRILRRRSSKDLSKVFLFTRSLPAVTWLAYAVYTNNTPLLVVSSCVFLGMMFFFHCVYRFDKGGGDTTFEQRFIRGLSRAVLKDEDENTPDGGRHVTIGFYPRTPPDRVTIID